MNVEQVITRLRDLADPTKITIKQTKFGIKANHCLGVYQKDLKALAAEIGYDDKLAVQLFDSGIYEARILCAKIHNPDSISEALLEKWVVTFDNWEICDAFCMGPFVKSRYALDKISAWTGHESEYIKRAGFVIMACYGFAHKHAGNKVFKQFLPLIKLHACDERVYVKKAVNWALRNIGKRNIDLHKAALTSAKGILKLNNKTARWIANDAIRELTHPNVNILDYPREKYRKPVTN